MILQVGTGAADRAADGRSAKLGPDIVSFFSSRDTSVLRCCTNSQSTNTHACGKLLRASTGTGASANNDVRAQCVIRRQLASFAAEGALRRWQPRRVK